MTFNPARKSAASQRGAASVEYALVTIAVVSALILFNDSNGVAGNTVVGLAKAITDFYNSYTNVISLATP